MTLYYELFLAYTKAFQRDKTLDDDKAYEILRYPIETKTRAGIHRDFELEIGIQLVTARQTGSCGVASPQEIVLRHRRINVVEAILREYCHLAKANGSHYWG